MKRSIKKNVGVYAFLDASGLLENGTAKEIEHAKKEYWKEVRKKYNKRKRKENKSFQLFFSFKEAEVITRQAKKYHSSEPAYIKQSALANKQNVIDWIVVGEIRELVIQHHTTLINLIEEIDFSQSMANKLLNQASQIEEKVFAFISLFK